jgi:hypothetical protein
MRSWWTEEFRGMPFKECRAVIDRNIGARAIRFAAAHRSERPLHSIECGHHMGLAPRE